MTAEGSSKADSSSKRTARVPIESNLFAVQEEGKVAEALRAMYQTSFGTPIRISNKEKETIGLDLYVKSRCEYKTATEGPRREPNPPKEFLYEQILHGNFWPKDKRSNVILLFLLGVVGCGKSTLLHYYLYEYCRKRSPNVNEYNRKLIVSINLRNKRDEKALPGQVYYLLRLRLLEECRERNFDILVADDCAMWHDLMGLESAAYTSWTITDKEKWVADRMKSITDEHFVKLALTYISKKIESGQKDFPFSYLVLILDNIDHSPYNIVEQVLELVHEWLEMGLKIWKIYLPMWPATFYQLRHKYTRFPKSPKVIQLGAIDEEKLFSLRNDKMLDLIKSAKTEVKTMDEVTNVDVTLKAEELGTYAHFGREEAPLEFRQLIQSLSGHSTHRELGLWLEVLTSPVMERHYLRERNRRAIQAGANNIANMHRTPFEFIAKYAWMDALCAGASRYHHKWSSPIPNLFYCLDEVESHFDILIGWHILLVVNHGGARTEQRICDLLLPLGHTKQKLNKALQYLGQKHLFEWIHDGRQDFDLYPGMGESYAFLVSNPAYCDNVALTSPLPVSRLEGMVLSRSDDPRHFVPRARTTIQFMEQIHADEEEFRTWVTGNRDGDFGMFQKALADARIPSVFDRMALAYKWRLQYLRRGKYLTFEVSDEEWVELLSKPIFAEIPDRPETAEQPLLRWNYLIARNGDVSPSHP